MSLESGAKLPQSLNNVISKLSLNSDPVEMNLGVKGLNEQNIGPFLIALFEKFEDNPEHLNKLIHFKFIGKENLTPSEQKTLSEYYNGTLKNKFDNLYKQSQEEQKQSQKEPLKEKDPEKIKQINETQAFDIFANKIKTISLSDVEDEQRRVNVLKAFELSIKSLPFSNKEARVAGVMIPEFPGSLKDFKDIAYQTKTEIVINNAKSFLAEVKPHGKESSLDQMLEYANNNGIASGNAKPSHKNMEEPIFREYEELLWPLVQKEAIHDLESAYKVKKKDPIEDFFNEVYTSYYEKDLKKAIVGPLNLLPTKYSSSIYHHEMLKACLKFLEIGGFQSSLKEAKFSLTSPNGYLPKMAYDFSQIIDPLIEHVQNGRPLPFNTMHIKHNFECQNFYQGLIEFAKAIADKPGVYYHLESIRFQPSEIFLDENPNVDAYEAYLQEMIRLAEKEPNGLSVWFNLIDISGAISIKLNDDETRTNEIKALEDKLNLLVAQNRRAINITILYKGAFGEATSILADAGKATQADSMSEIRACKRILDLKGALGNIATEQEAEQEQEQEKGQEKGQDQGQEMEQAHGSADDNLASARDFIAFMQAERPTLSDKTQELRELWKNIFSTSPLKAMSKDVARLILADPDAFKYGLVEGNLPAGFRIGNLIVEDAKTGENKREKGIYYDIAEQNEVSPLTISIKGPPTKRARLPVSSADFILKSKPRNLDPISKKLVKKVFTPLTQEEIVRFNTGKLKETVNDNGVLQKMIFMTSKVEVPKFISWLMSDITQKIFNTNRNQELAEIAVDYGGDVFFALNEKLEKIQSRCKNIKPKRIFDQFLDKVILQNKIDSIADRQKLGDHLMQYDQFQALDKIKSLPDDELSWFMNFCCEHAKYHSRLNINELYLGFKEFVKQYKALTSEETPLPKGADKLAQDCKNMKVGLDRILFILNNAQKNNLLSEQLKVLDELDLNYNAAYEATKGQHYRIILPEMDIKDIKDISEISGVSDISEEKYVPAAQLIYGDQSRRFQECFHDIKRLPNCRRSFFCHYGITETAPSLSEINDIDKFISNIKSPPYANPEQVQAFLYTISSFCLYHNKGIRDASNLDKLQRLAKSIDDVIPHKGSFEFLARITRCQGEHFVNGNGDSPTLDSLTSFIDTMNRIKKYDPAIIGIGSFDPLNHYQNNQDLFEPFHKIAINKNSKLSDPNLAHTLSSFKSVQNPDNATKRFRNLHGGILHALALIADPDDNFRNKESDDSFDAFAKKCIDEYCGDDQVAAFSAVENLLNVIRFAKVRAQGTPPTWKQLKEVIPKATLTLNPQSSLEESVEWIKTQPGFENLEFILPTLKPDTVKAQTFEDAFNSAKGSFIKGLKKIGITLDEDSYKDFNHFLIKLKEAKVEKKFRYNVLLAQLKKFIYKTNQAALKSIAEIQLNKLTPSEKKNISDRMEALYKPITQKPKSIDDLLALSTQYAEHHAKLNALLEQINQTKTILKSTFTEVLNTFSAPQKEIIPIDNLTQLLAVLNQHAQTANIFPHDILKQALKFEEKITDWDTLNRVLEKTILPESKINQEKLYELSLLLSSKGKLSLGTIQPLLELSRKSGSYALTAQFIINQIKQDQKFDITLTCNHVLELIKRGVDEKSITGLLNQLNKDHIVMQGSAILNELQSIKDKDKLVAITSILSSSLAQSKSVTRDEIRDVVENLQKLDMNELKKLSELDIDPPFPTVQQLYNNGNPIRLKEFIESLEGSYSKLRNDEKELAIIFNDDRVIPVLNMSNSLDFKKPAGIALTDKDRLLQDYAYIHAIGFNQPVYDGKPLKDLSKAKLLYFKEELTKKLQDKSLDPDKMKLATLQYIALIRQIYYNATFNADPNKKPPRGIFPYSTQIIALLQALRYPNMNINEIATGQGKSLIAALKASVLTAQGRPAIICTSDQALAQAGVEENKAFYQYMGIPTTVIQAQSPSKNFLHNGINYSDVTNAALFLAKGDMEDPPLSIEDPGLILDEVDFTVLDEVTDFRYAVTLGQIGLSSEVNLDEWIYHQINAFVDSEKFLGQPVTRKADVYNAIYELEKKLDLAIKDTSLKDPALSYVKKRLSEFKIPDTKGWKQLDTWIDSAYNAKIIYEQGKGTAWTLEQYQHKDGKTYSAARIISHHRVSKGSKWSKGVHQFLSARINEKMAPQLGVPLCRIETEKAYIAALSSKNFVDYFTRRGGSVWGITGTIGSAEERAELIKKYGFKLTKIETHQRRIAEVLPPIFPSGGKAHVDAIFGKYKKHALNRNQMPTVIFEEDADYAAKLKGKFLRKLEAEAKNLVKASKEPPLFQYFDGMSYEIYKFNGKKYVLQEMKSYDESDIKRQAGKQNTITIATPLMGRGTDFKPVDKQGNDHPDGLFVIGAYPESSEREERQIVGRMGRQGRAGLFLNIVNKNRFIDKLDAEGIHVPLTVRYFHPNRLTKRMSKFQESKNMSLAKERKFKQTYGDIRAHFYYKFTGMLKMIYSKEGLNTLMNLCQPKPADPDEFKRKFKENLLSCWNEYLVEFETKYNELKDQDPGDFNKIFSKLTQYAGTEWNNVVNSMRQFSQIPSDDDEANIFFKNYQLDDEYETFIKHIIEEGEKSSSQDPSQTYHTLDISHLLINYPKHFILRDTSILTTITPRDAMKGIAQILAIDMLNHLHRLNESIKHDRHLALRPVPINLEEMKKKIDTQPVGAYKTLLNDYHKLSFYAQALTQERDPNNKVYHDLQEEMTKDRENVYKELKKIPIGSRIINEFIARYDPVRKPIEEAARDDLYIAKHQTHPQPHEDRAKPTSFASESITLFQREKLMTQLSANDRRKTFLISPNSKHRNQKLVNLIFEFSRSLIQDVQLADPNRFEIMRGFLWTLKDERKVNKKEALFIERLVLATMKAEIECCKTPDPKKHEDCQKSYKDYTPPDIKSIAREKQPKMPSVQ